MTIYRRFRVIWSKSHVDSSYMYRFPDAISYLVFPPFFYLMAPMLILPTVGRETSSSFIVYNDATIVERI